MDRINHSTAVDIGDGRRGFRSKDTVAGQAGTVVTAHHLNASQEELVRLIEKAGLIPNGNDFEQVLTVIRSQRLNYVPVVAGTANTLTATLDPEPISNAALTSTPLRIKPALTNTGAATLNLNGLGALPITRIDGTSVSAGELPAGATVELIATGTAYVITNLNPALLPANIYEVFATTQTWVIPAGTYRIDFLMAGGGGGGGGANSSSSYGGGGGGAGGFVEGSQLVTPGDTLNITAGQGGLGGAAPTGDQGATGGSTTISVAGKFTVTAAGGQGGNVGGPGSPGLGGNGTGGTSNSFGTTGGSGMPGAARNGGAFAFGGTGGGGRFGTGGGSNTASTATAGTNPGSGGGGGYNSASNSYSGGRGADGIVIIRRR